MLDVGSGRGENIHGGRGAHEYRDECFRHTRKAIAKRNTKWKDILLRYDSERTFVERGIMDVPFGNNAPSIWCSIYSPGTGKEHRDEQ